MSDYERGYNHGCRDTLRKCVVTKDAEQAVIEAVGHCIKNNYPPEPIYDRERWDHMVAMYRALQEVRDE